MDKGMHVDIIFTKASGFENTTLNNVTEVHYNYRPGMIAFESDIHSTGITYPQNIIWQMTCCPDPLLHDDF